MDNSKECFHVYAPLDDYCIHCQVKLPRRNQLKDFRTIANIIFDSIPENLSEMEFSALEDKVIEVLDTYAKGNIKSHKSTNLPNGGWKAVIIFNDNSALKIQVNGDGTTDFYHGIDYGRDVIVHDESKTRH